MAEKKHMKKTTKGAIAALLGIGLLGGYGTFALWSDSATVDGGTLTAGNLDISTVGSPAWSDVSPAGANGWIATADMYQKVDTPKTIDPATFLMVPGDLVQMTQKVTIIATGDNLKAQVSVDPASLTVDPALAGHVSVGLVLLDAEGAVKATSTPNAALTFATPKTDADGDSYTVQVRIGFDGLTGDRDGVNSTIDLTGAKVALNQVRS